MEPTNHTARLAGWLYILMGVPAVFSLQYVPRALIVSGNAAATAERVRASETLLRAGVVGELVSCIGWILLAWALYRLLAGVHRGLASMMAGLVAISIAITFANALNDLAALTLFRAPEFLSGFDKRQLEGLGMFFLGLHLKGTFVNEIFWGLWLLPFGALVMRSGFLPRTLGILLLVNGAAWVVSSLVSLLAPAWATDVHRWLLIPEFGELWIMLWLLIKGVHPKPVAAGIAPATIT